MSVKVPAIEHLCSGDNLATYSPTQPIMQFKEDYTSQRYEQWKLYKQKKLTPRERKQIVDFARNAI